MAYAHVQSFISGAQSGLTAVATLAAVTAGNLLVLGTRQSSENRSIVSVSDGVNTWQDTGHGRVSGSGSGVYLYYAMNVAGGTTTVTVTWDTSGVTNAFLVLAEYSGILTSGAVDVADGNATTGASNAIPSAGTDTVAQAGELLISWFHSDTASRPCATPTCSVGGVTFNDRQSSTGASYGVLFSDARLTATTAFSISQPVTGGNSVIDGLLTTFEESAGAAVSPSTGLPDTLAERSGQSPYAQVLISGGLF